jgi:hypothetical protein
MGGIIVYDTPPTITLLYCNTTVQTSMALCGQPTSVDCTTPESVDRSFRALVGQPIKWLNYSPDVRQLSMKFYCEPAGVYWSWMSEYTGENTTPASCNADDVSLHVRAASGTVGTARASFGVTCTRKTDVVLSLTSETMNLTGGGSAKLSLNDQGPRLTMKGITSAVVDVSATVNDTTLPAGVYDGSTVVTIAPL